MNEQSVKTFYPLVHLDSVILSFLQAYFKFHPKYPWSDITSETKIDLVEQYSEEDNEIGGNPRIVIRRGPFSLTSLTLGSQSPTAGKSLIEWSQTKEKLYKAGAVYTISISTRVPRETLDLAEEVLSTILMYVEPIAQAFQVKIEEHGEASTDELLSTGKYKDASTITLTFAANYQYKLSIDILPRYETLKGVDLLGDVDKTVEQRNKLKFESLQFNAKL